MNKSYLIALAILVLLLVGAYMKLFIAQAGFNGSIDSKTGVFVVENFNSSKIKIITGKTDKISVDLKGPKDEVDKVRFFKTDSDGAGFTFSDEWQELSGTIIVPEGTLLDIRLADEIGVVINNELIGNSKSFLVDTNSVDSIVGGGSISIESSSDPIIWDTDSWDPIDSPDDDDDDGLSSSGTTDESNDDDQDDEYVPAECSVGSQVIRNYCCERLNEDNVPSPTCDGFGYYAFNNLLRECEFQCESEDSEDEEEGVDVCSIGSQLVRNDCCAQQNIGADTSYCVGEWQFNNLSRLCNYHCFTEDELEEYFGGGDDNDGSSDELRLCENFESSEDKDECCDYNLANELSIGPRTGFPDCIGRWYFDNDDGCSFRCADYTEMIEILKELQQIAQENQEEQ